MANPPPEIRELLRKHFEDENSPSKWDKLWKDNILPWDKGAPNPALVDTLSSRKDLIGTSASEGRKKRAFVPGCGRGYDVLLLASHGYDAVGLDGSETAIEGCNQIATEQLDKYPLQEGVKERGSIKFVLGDFFEKSRDYEDGRFDLIYDYTFLCALPPARRPGWAQRMVDLLSPTGRLVCLEFPLNKPPSTMGPPWGVTAELYEQHLSKPGQEVSYNDEGYVVVPQGFKAGGTGLVRLDRWMPERTHEAGQGMDHMSVWKRA